MNKTPSSQLVGVLFSVCAAFGFSFKAIFVKLAYEQATVDAITLLMLRMTLSLPFVILIALRGLRSGSPLQRRDYLLLLLLGIVGYYGSAILDFMGLRYITAGLERLILFTYPALTILMGVLFLGKRFEKKVLLALALSWSGILLAFVHDLQISGDMHSLALGGGLVAAAALLYAIYNAGSEAAIRRMGSMKFSVLALLVSSLATQTHFYIAQPLSVLNLPWQVYLWCGAMALFSTVLPIFWQSAAVQRIGAERAVLIGLLGPMLTIFFSWWLLGEPISLAQIAGTLLVMAGVLVVIRH